MKDRTSVWKDKKIKLPNVSNSGKIAFKKILRNLQDCSKRSHTYVTGVIRDKEKIALLKKGSNKTTLI